MCKRITLLIFLLLSLSWASPTWLSMGFAKRVPFIVNPCDSSVILNDFPCLVNISGATWLDAAQTNGGDICFTGDDGMMLFHEMETYLPNTQLSAWICLPTFTNNTRIWMYWKNNSTGFQFSGSNTWTNQNVWVNSLIDPSISRLVWDTNFVCVYHFAEASGMPLDSSVWATAPDYVDGNISYKSGGIGGTYGYYSVGQPNRQGIRNPSFKSGVLSNRAFQNQITTSMWFKWAVRPSDPAIYLMSNFPTWTNYAALCAFQANSSALSTDGRGVLYYERQDQLNGYIYGKGSNQPAFGKFTAPDVGEWRYYAVSGGQVLPISNVFMTYNDQTSVATNAASWSTTSNVQSLYVLGCTQTAANTYRWSPWGTADEFRLSFTIRSSNWLMEEYSNALSTTTVDTNGTETFLVYLSNNYITANTNTNSNVITTTSVGGISAQPGTSTFIASQADALQVPIVSTYLVPLFVKISVISINGGKRFELYQGNIQALGTLNASIGSPQLSRLTPGVYIMETRFYSMHKNDDALPVNRRLLFYAK